jgi:hypothetical protein
MLIKDIKNSIYFKAMDETILCELLHPKKEGIIMGCSIAHAVLDQEILHFPINSINPLKFTIFLREQVVCR